MKIKANVLYLIMATLTFFSTFTATAYASEAGISSSDYVEGPPMPQEGQIQPFHYYQSSGGRWWMSASNWHYYKADGMPLKDSWLKATDGQWYYFDGNGFMKTLIFNWLPTSPGILQTYYLRKRATPTNKYDGAPTGPGKSSWGSMITGPGWFRTYDAWQNYMTFSSSGIYLTGQNQAPSGSCYF